MPSRYLCAAIGHPAVGMGRVGQTLLVIAVGENHTRFGVDGGEKPAQKTVIYKTPGSACADKRGEQRHLSVALEGVDAYRVHR